MTNIWGLEKQIEKRRFLIRELEQRIQSLNPRRKEERSERDHLHHIILGVRDQMSALREKIKHMKEQRKHGGKKQ